MTKETSRGFHFPYRGANRARRQPAGPEGAFTLIELLVVIAVIALLAGMIMPITGAVTRNKIRNRSRVEMARIIAAIDSYKAKLGHYPPDAAQSPDNRRPRVTVNQLYYELVGTVAQSTRKGNRYTTLDGSSTIDSSTIQPNFNVSGFINSTQGATSDETPPAQNFMPGIRPDQVDTIPDPAGGNSGANNVTNAIKILVGYRWKKLPVSANVDLLFTVDPIPIKGAEGKNPWRYRSHTDQQHPTLNNPDSYDLWLDVNIGGTVYRICNWSTQPLKVTQSLDN